MFELTNQYRQGLFRRNWKTLPLPHILEFHLVEDIFHNAQTDCDWRSYCLGHNEVEEDLPDPGADSYKQETEEREKNPEEKTDVRGMDQTLQ